MGFLTNWLSKGMEEEANKYKDLLKQEGFIANKVICNVYSHTIFAVDTENKKWCSFEDKDYYVKLEKHPKLDIDTYTFNEFVKYDIQMVDGKSWDFKNGVLVGGTFIGTTTTHQPINQMKVIITTNSKDIDKSSVVVKLSNGIVNYGTSGYNQIISIMEELQKIFEYILNNK